MLHVFRNTPLGRENLMQSAYFCKKTDDLRLEVYIPQRPQFTLDLGGDLFAVQLDTSYTRFPKTAETHVAEVMKSAPCSFGFVGPHKHDVGTMPHLPGEWAVMACPRVVSEQSSRIGLGHLGPKVRGLVKSATFPVFIPALAYKEWNSVTAFFGGSDLGALAVKVALAFSKKANVPVSLHTQLDGITRDKCETSLASAGILDDVKGKDISWRLYDTGELAENLYDVPHDSLVVVGAAGYNVITELVFGSTLEVIQSTLPNPLVVVGPRCKTPWEK